MQNSGLPGYGGGKMMISVRLGYTISMTDERARRKSTEFNKLVLAQLKPRIGRETANMLNDLVDDTKTKVESAPVATDQGTDYSPAAVNCVGRKNELMVGWLDEIFDCFQQFGFEFNKALTRQDLYVHVQRPAIVQEQVTLRDGRKVVAQFFKGVISTKEWALVMRGQDHFVEVFLVPTQAIGALSSNSNVARLLVMLPYRNGAGQPAYRIDGDVVSWEDLRPFSKQLYGCLVKLAKGELELTTSADATFPMVPRAPMSTPVSGAEALAKLRSQTESASAATVPDDEPVPTSLDAGTSSTLAALLERKRKQHEVQKMTGRTRNRFKQKFSESLDKPELK